MGNRTWADDDLRDAVEHQKSWRGVLRQLGLNASSGGSIGVVKRRAQDLGLDTSHFTGPRRWSDRDLQQAIEKSSSWSDVANQLGLIRERRTGLRLKGQALRLGLNVSHLEDHASPRPSVDHLDSSPLLSELRSAAPSIAAAWFGLRGFSVAFPVEPEEYDLLVTTSESVLRVQVKSTTSRSRSGKWRVGIGQRPYPLAKDARRIPYDPASLDYFVIVNGSGEIYVIPIEVVAGLTSIYLSAYEDYRVGSVASLLEDASEETVT